MFCMNILDVNWFFFVDCWFVKCFECEVDVLCELCDCYIGLILEYLVLKILVLFVLGVLFI